jgi:OmcA/MtrC family decaheme c-type cytochrome
VTARDTGVNQQWYFSVDSSKVEPRRTVVDMAKCNQCHKALAFHGEIRNTIAECVICHNPTMTAAGTPRRSIEMGVLIHKIHRGRNLERGYSIGSNVYNDVGFPGILSNCNTCHINNSQQLPLNKGQLPVENPFELINPAGRETAACISCHDSKSAAAHAALNTHPTLGESCATCHGANSEYSVNRVHAQ